MVNWRTRIGAAAVAAGLGVVLLGTGAVLSPAAQAEAKKEEKDKRTYSPDCQKLLKAAQDAGQKKDFDTMLSLAQQALAASKNSLDTETSTQFIAQAYGNKSDYPNYAIWLEKINELDTIPEDQKVRNYKPLAQIYGQQKDYEKAAKYATLWAEHGGGSEAYQLLSQVYLIQKDCKNGIVALEKSIAGRDPNESELRQQNFCYYQLGDKPKRQMVMETLVQKFLKREYLADLIGIYQEQNIDPRALLNLWRFMFDKEFMTRESEFIEYADNALDAGAPAEALKVLETGKSKDVVKFIAPTDRNSKMLAQAKAQTADDRKLLPQLDKEARAGKSGEADVKVGLAYLGFGEYDKAVEAIERGLTAERIAKVKRPDDSRMNLAIAYLKLGKKDDAVKAFTAAQQDPRMAKAATIWLQSL